MDFETIVARLNRDEGLAVRHETMMRLRAQGEGAKPTLFAALGHPAWRVRYASLRILDHTVVDDETRLRVLAALEDPHRKVRRAALHLLGCEPCKPEGFCGIEGVDVEAMYLDMIERDRSALVRFHAAARFQWRSELPFEVRDRLERVLVAEQSEAVRLRIARVLLWPEIYGDGTSRYVDRLDEYNARVDELLAVACDRANRLPRPQRRP